MDKINSFTIKAGEDHSENDKTILIYIDINYKYNSNIIYEYSIQKTTENKTLEFKSYLLNWYTKYKFSITYIHPRDIVFISTNNSFTIRSIRRAFVKRFHSFYETRLLVSEPDYDYFDKIYIEYNDERAYKQAENDMGYFEVFKFNKDLNSFEEIYINKDFENKVFYLNINRDKSSYFYIRMETMEINDYYYLCY